MNIYEYLFLLMVIWSAVSGVRGLFQSLINFKKYGVSLLIFSLALLGSVTLAWYSTRYYLPAIPIVIWIIYHQIRLRNRLANSSYKAKMTELLQSYTDSATVNWFDIRSRRIYIGMRPGLDIMQYFDISAEIAKKGSSLLEYTVKVSIVDSTKYQKGYRWYQGHYLMFSKAENGELVEDD